MRSARLPPAGLIREALGGFAALGQYPDARLIVMLTMAQTFIRGALNVLIVVSALTLLHMGESGVGFLTAVLIILSMGIIATNVVGRRVLAFGDSLLLRVPVYRRLYPSVKQLIEAFSPEKRNSLKAVVLAEHPREGEFVFGFVTSELVVEGPDGKRDMVTVFVPTNNLYLGDIVVLPRDAVLATGLSVEEGIRIILSAGTATPPRIPRSSSLSEIPRRQP